MAASARPEGAALEGRGRAADARVSRRCPRCGRKLYEKLCECGGEIMIKCPRCGSLVRMNLALRRAR